MNIKQNDIRFCVLIRGIRSSTTKEMVTSYCEKYGHVNYCNKAINPQGIMRGYNLVFKQEQSVNRFMDNRPHRIDGQSVKVRRCIAPDEEWRLTNKIFITTSDNSNDKQIFDEQILRDYFCRYGTVRTCQIDTHHNRPCAYLVFTDFDRVDQLINDKPHIISKINLTVRKYVSDNYNKTQSLTTEEISKSNLKRREHPSTDFDQLCTKQQRSSTKTRASEMFTTEKYSTNDEINRLKTANELLIQEVQSLISPSIEQPTINNEIIHLKTEYERLTTQINRLRSEQIGSTSEILDKLYHDVKILVREIENMRQEKKTFDDELFEKYTVEYILSLTEKDVKQRCEQLEKENQLLLLIKQNLINNQVSKL